MANNTETKTEVTLEQLTALGTTFMAARKAYNRPHDAADSPDLEMDRDASFSSLLDAWMAFYSVDEEKANEEIDDSMNHGSPARRLDLCNL